jgi:hypothetical protein
MVATLIALALIVVVLVSFAFLPSYLRRHPDKRGSGSTGSGVLGGAFDAFAPSAAEARAALDEQQRLIVPAPSPDCDLGISDGRIRIRLPRDPE